MKLVVVLAAGLLLAACGGGEPDIDLAESQTDLGTVINGEILEFEVVVENLGSGELLIEAVTTSCGCTTAEVTPSAIAPGGTGLLEIRYDSGAHGPDEVGQIMRQVFVASNDPDEAEVEFRFSADVIAAQS